MSGNANADVDYWKPKARFEGDLGRIYGVQWRSWQVPDGQIVDQLSNAIQGIKTQPYRPPPCSNSVESG